MSSALSLEREPPLNKSLSHNNTFNPRTGFQHTEVVADYSNRAIWVRTKAEAPLFVTSDFLTEIKAISESYALFDETPFKFRVFKSDLPKTFSLGGDLRLFKACIQNHDRFRLQQYALDAAHIIYDNCSGGINKDLFTVTLVDGEAQGGGFEAALSGNLLVAEKGVSFGFPERLFGLFPGMGARQLLAARVGSTISETIINSTRRWTAEELFELGVVDILTQPSEAEKFLRQFLESTDPTELNKYKSRFAQISKSEIEQTVSEWVDIALELSSRDLQAIDLILLAQEKAHNTRLAYS